MTPARAGLLTAALAAAALVAGGMWVVRSGPAPSEPAPSAMHAGRANRSPGPSRSRDVAAAALEVLHGWDADRARAYADGRPERLRRLYVPGASAGRADVELLRAYHRRGLRVAAMSTQVLSLAVLEHRPDRWRLRVTDRLAGAVAVGRRARIPLPRDRASRHVITLMRADDGSWRVAAVR